MAPHWTTAYLGRPWRPGAFECVDLVLEVAEAVTGRRPVLPPYAASRGARDGQVAALAETYADPVDTPRDGDVALMAPRGAQGGGHHLGVAALVEGVPHVLHVAEGRGACLHPVHVLPAHGWTVRGWFRWKDRDHRGDTPCPGPPTT